METPLLSGLQKNLDKIETEEFPEKALMLIVMRLLTAILADHASPPCSCSQLVDHSAEGQKGYHAQQDVDGWNSHDREGRHL